MCVNIFAVACPQDMTYKLVMIKTMAISEDISLQMAIKTKKQLQSVIIIQFYELYQQNVYYKKYLCQRNLVRY